MLFIWFWLVAVMITGYVVLDGFDLGAGVLHLFIAKTDQERQTVIRTIGPVWDGNEVWLLAGGGTLYFAFPLLYASGFSGFYLPLMIVLWLLILRGIGIELRMHLAGTVWRGFFDGCFALSSILLAVFYGAALGNVIRGVPLNQERYFFLPLWTNWRPCASWSREEGKSSALDSAVRRESHCPRPRHRRRQARCWREQSSRQRSRAKQFLQDACAVQCQCHAG